MKKIIRSFLQQFGYDIVKYKPPFTRGKLNAQELQEEYQWLRDYHFKSIVDIGANEGQFSDKMRILFPYATIYAFEPLPGVFEKLKINFNKDQLFKPFNLGLGEQKGELEFWENEYSPSSSFLGMADTHKKNFEEAVQSKKVKVSVERMDEVFASENPEQPLLIKIDVQGFEDKVIRGGMSTLRKATVIICELSFVELYQGQLLFADLFEEFRKMGFNYAGSIEQLKSPGTNQILQADGIFIKQP
jgi:FkbM family methyltransferase